MTCKALQDLATLVQAHCLPRICIVYSSHGEPLLFSQTSQRLSPHLAHIPLSLGAFFLLCWRDKLTQSQFQASSAQSQLS